MASSRAALEAYEQAITATRARAAKEARRAALDRLFQSLLHHMMTGTVRVHHVAEQLALEATA